jgi:hypothetical protein
MIIIQNATMDDARLRQRWVAEGEIAELVAGEKELNLLGAMKGLVDSLGGRKNVRTMDVWWSVLTRK